ncbi:MAG: type II secretion system protein [Candidatus Omnitrophica bacterium]|nr:type II secretion system protein [Candidatus Omnitrophota bacterium]MCB9720955.1 type II secretion system protein [Candidatus Omnitrophota bacterium]
MKGQQGFTLLELLFAVSVLVTAIAGMVRLFMYTSTAADIAGRQTIAVTEAQTKLEEIRNTNYDLVATNYGSGGSPGNTFDLSLINGKGVIYIDSSNAELLVLEIVVSWNNKYNRVVGEDKDLDGILDAGEDENGNGKLDSSVELITYLTRR